MEVRHPTTVMALAKLTKLLAVQGLNDKVNDILVSKVNPAIPKGLVIFFHGDQQVG